MKKKNDWNKGFTQVYWQVIYICWLSVTIFALVGVSDMAHWALSAGADRDLIVVFSVVITYVLLSALVVFSLLINKEINKEIIKNGGKK